MPDDQPTIPFSIRSYTDEQRLERARVFAELMHERRSVRHFSSEPVPKALIEQVLRAANAAPSGANKQPWTFVAISNAELRRRIRTEAEHVERESYERRMPDEWLRDLEVFQTTWQKPHITAAAWIIVVFAQTHGLDAEGNRSMHYYVKESVGLAVGFFLAACQDAGLATLTHTPSPMGFLKEVLERPQNESAYLLIPVGYPTEDCRVPDIKRKDLDEYVVWRE